MCHNPFRTGYLSNQINIFEIDTDMVEGISNGNIIDVVLVFVLIESVTFFLAIFKNLLHLRRTQWRIGIDFNLVTLNPEPFCEQFDHLLRLDDPLVDKVCQENDDSRECEYPHLIYAHKSPK